MTPDALISISTTAQLRATSYVSMSSCRHALYEAHRDDGGPKGWLGVSADEADALALRLTEMASEVRALQQQ
jgi:hypothetical protein